ncbi:MAG: Gfo/Idh/MocA family protein [Candidatus Omnitrophota bacterium]
MISLALIGCGHWGMNHLKTWNELGCLRVVVDINPGPLAKAKADFPHFEVSSDPFEVMKRPDIDAVVIASPATTHASLALKALESGKDVLVEKPMALTVRDAERLVRTANRLKRVLMVGHVLEYHPAIEALKEMIQERKLGVIRYAYSNRLNFGRIRTEENSLWSFAPHDIAILLRLFGKLPQSVCCTGGSYLNETVSDISMTTLSFAGNIQAHIFVSWLHPYKAQQLVIIGDKQMAVFDDTKAWPEKLLLYPHTVKWDEKNIPLAQKAESIPVTLPEKAPLKEECEHFLSCIRDSSRPLTDGESGVRVLKVLEKAQKSYDRKGSIVC